MKGAKNSSKGFEDALGAIQEKSKRKVRKFIRDICKDVVMGTPVDTGRLKNNWYASNRSPSSRSTMATDPSGSASMARVDAALTKLQLGQTFYLTNSLPYARTVEYGLYPNPPKNPTGKTVNGFSKMAPQGMLRVSLRRGMARLRSEGKK